MLYIFPPFQRNDCAVAYLPYIVLGGVYRLRYKYAAAEQLVDMVRIRAAGLGQTIHIRVKLRSLIVEGGGAVAGVDDLHRVYIVRIKGYVVYIGSAAERVRVNYKALSRRSA